MRNTWIKLRDFDLDCKSGIAVTDLVKSSGLFASRDGEAPEPIVGLRQNLPTREKGVAECDARKAATEIYGWEQKNY